MKNLLKLKKAGLIAQFKNALQERYTYHEEGGVTYAVPKDAEVLSTVVVATVKGNTTNKGKAAVRSEGELHWTHMKGVDMVGVVSMMLMTVVHDLSLTNDGCLPIFILTPNGKLSNGDIGQAIASSAEAVIELGYNSSSTDVFVPTATDSDLLMYIQQNNIRLGAVEDDTPIITNIRRDVKVPIGVYQESNATYADIEAMSECGENILNLLVLPVGEAIVPDQSVGCVREATEALSRAFSEAAPVNTRGYFKPPTRIEVVKLPDIHSKVTCPHCGVLVGSVGYLVDGENRILCGSCAVDRQRMNAMLPNVDMDLSTPVCPSCGQRDAVEHKVCYGATVNYCARCNTTYIETANMTHAVLASGIKMSAPSKSGSRPPWDTNCDYCGATIMPQDTSFDVFESKDIMRTLCASCYAQTELDWDPRTTIVHLGVPVEDGYGNEF